MMGIKLIDDGNMCPGRPHPQQRIARHALSRPAPCLPGEAAARRRRVALPPSISHIPIIN